MIPIHDLYVFGCFGSGHQLFRPDRSRALGAELYDVERACDGTPVDATVQVEGALVACTVPPGWSYVTWWDRQGDSRLGSHTGILARGTWSAEQLVTAARAHAPWAFRVPVQVAAVVAEAERDATRRDLAALRDYLTRSVADDIAVHDAWDILNALAPEDLARVLKWADEIDGRPKKPVQIPAVLFHRLLSAGLKAAEGDVLEWITARVERCAEVESEAHRLRDLVRHQRGPLHDADLITDEEYAALAADAGAVARLRGYDEMRRELAELRTFGASIHKAVAAALEARAKELDIAADTQDAYTEGPDDAVRVETLRRAASIVRGGR